MATLRLVKNYARELFVAALLGVCVGLALYFSMPMSMGIYMLLLASSLVASAVAVVLCQKKFSRNLAAVFNKVSAISIGTAEISYNLDQLKNSISEQAKLSDDSAEIIKQVGADSQYLSHMSAATVDSAVSTRTESSQGSQDVESIIQKIQSVDAELNHASDIVNKLFTTTKQIEKVTEFVKAIATATNLLSLNAAISAAQAGVHGKSFAVIASEIRKLSMQTTDAITEINHTLQDIQTGTKDSVNAMSQLGKKISGVVDTSNQIQKILEGIHATATATEQQSSQMVNALGEYVGTTNEVSDNVLAVKERLEVIAGQSKLASQQSMGLASLTEDIHAVLFKFSIADNKHEEVRLIASRVSQKTTKQFEAAISQGILTEDDLFDYNYQPISGTNPTKYHTKFDAFTDEVLPSLQEPALAELESLIFVIATDINGYVPTHNLKYSDTLTGRYAVDLAKSRSKRIFNDHVGSRCGSHTEDLLLQTYKRDTGEIMHDLSVPVYVNGRHWGGIRVGYLASTD